MQPTENKNGDGPTLNRLIIVHCHSLCIGFYLYTDSWAKCAVCKMFGAPGFSRSQQLQIPASSRCASQDFWWRRLRTSMALLIINCFHCIQILTSLQSRTLEHLISRTSLPQSRISPCAGPLRYSRPPEGLYSIFWFIVVNSWCLIWTSRRLEKRRNGWTGTTTWATFCWTVFT